LNSTIQNEIGTDPSDPFQHPILGKFSTDKSHRPRHLYLVPDQAERDLIRNQTRYTLQREIIFAEDWAQLTELLSRQLRSLCVNSRHVTMPLYDIINMIDTLARCVGQDRQISITLGINSDTPYDLIRAAKKSRVFGIVPAGSDYGLAQSIQAMHFQWDGIAYWPQHIIRDLPGNYVAPVVGPGEIRLTDRQQQIFDLVTTRGCSNKQVARLLNLSESTVKLHLSAVFRKYGVINRTQLAVFSQPRVD